MPAIISRGIYSMTGSEIKAVIMYKVLTIVVLVNLVYFEAGLVVSIIGALIPDIIKVYGLSYSGSGLFHSLMWPLILSPGVNPVKKHHGSLSGLLFAASCGGAFGPMMIGSPSDLFGLRWGFSF